MSNELTTARPTSVSTPGVMLDAGALERMSRAAEMMATARTTIPKHLAGSPGDCFAVCIQAVQWGMNPFAVAQKTHLVNGQLGYEAQLVNAVVSSSPLLATRIAYEFEGDWTKVQGKTDKDDSRAVTVSAMLRGETKPRTLRISMAQVGEVRNSPLWASDPRQQLAYLATKRWARLHAPDVMLGVYTPDELAEAPERAMGPADVVTEDAPAPVASRTEAVKSKLKARRTEPAVTLAQVLARLEAAESEEDLSEAGELAGRLSDPVDKAHARSAWKAKAELIRQVPVVEESAPVGEPQDEGSDQAEEF